MSAFNAYIALGGAAIVLSTIGAVIIFVRSISKRAASERAVERLRNLPGGKPLAPLPAATPEMLVPVSGEAPPAFERAEPLAVQAVVRTEAPQPVGAKVRSFLEHAEPSEVQPAATLPELPLQVGTKVWAVCNFGAVPKGTPGIITGTADGRFSWQSPMYLCTFADNRKVRARPRDIEAYNHVHGLQELEQPNLGEIQSRHMISRAQQFASRHR